MSIKFGIVRGILKCIGFIMGDKYKHSQEYEDNFKYMDTAEKLWWGYKCVIRQPELAEKGKNIEEYFAKQNLEFKAPQSFIKESSLVLNAAGDLNSSPMIQPDNTEHLFDDIEDFYFNGDIICANLETPLYTKAPASGVPQMSFTAPKLNTSPEMFERFARGGKGINFFSTANNHSLDQGEDGLIATLDFLDSKGYPHVGTSRTPEEQRDIPIIEVKGIRVAIISYTYCMNGNDPIEDKEYMTNVVRLNKPDTDITLIQEHIKIANEKEADIVVAMLHWSVEFETYPIENIIKMGHRIMESGVDIILGSHPHVSQPMEKYRFIDPYTKHEKDGFIVYSLGDFVAHEPYTRNSRISTTLKFEISKGKINNRTVTRITDLKIQPIYIGMRKFEDEKTELRLLDYEKLMKQLEIGINKYNFSDKEIKELKRLGNLLYNKLLPRNSSEILVKVKN